MRPFLRMIVIAAGLWANASPPASGGEEPGGQVLAVAVHVHSTVSSGTLTLDQLADEAERVGVDALVLSDNFALRFEYGLFPFRGGLRARVGFPSVVDMGPARYLDLVEETQRRHPRVLLIPGVEVTPHYFWTGSLLAGDLTMHDTQRNLLVAGLSASEDYAALPVAGNPDAYQYDWRTVLDLMPAVLFIPAAWVWVGASGRPLRRWYAAGMGCLAVVLMANAWPFAHPVCSLYAGDCANRPSQAVIDLVAARGGLVYWSMPEARDDQHYAIGPLAAVTVRTEPYPEALRQTAGYTGFGGLYEDNHRMTDPGALWDDLLAQYLAGTRRAWPVLISESGFHGPGADHKRLDSVLSMVRVRERTGPAVLEALGAGRVYAVLRDPKKFLLRLDQFQVQCEGRQERASLGDTLEVNAVCHPAISVAVAASDGAAHPVRLTLVRSGEVIQQVSGQTPIRETVIDVEAPVGAPGYYRVEVRAEGELLSNPIFVRPAGLAN